MTQIYKAFVIFCCVCFGVPMGASAIDWAQCKKLVVKNTRYYCDYSKPLQPLADYAHRHVSVCIADGHTTHSHMRVGLQADYNAVILLSPDSDGIHFHFRIRVFKNTVDCGTVKDNIIYTLKNSVNDAINMNNTQAAALHLTIADGTLLLRNDATSPPFLEYHDERMRDVRYYGFDCFGNPDGQATFYYDC